MTIQVLVDRGNWLKLKNRFDLELLVDPVKRWRIEIAANKLRKIKDGQVWGK